MSAIDRNMVLQRAAETLATWLVIWLAQHLLIRKLRSVRDRSDRLEVSDRDLRTLEWGINFVLVILGLGVTLAIFRVAPLLLASIVFIRILSLTLVWAAVWLLVRYMSRWVQALDKRVAEIDIDPRDLATMDRLLDYAIILVGIVISLAILNLTSLLYSALTAAGVFSVIIGFAVKDIAANLVSGVFLFFDRPFVVGDTISIKEYTGVVTRISLRSTDIITLDGPVVTIPNSTMAVEPTTNYTLSKDRRVLFTLSVLSTADLNRVTGAIRGVLDAEKRLLKEKQPSIMVGPIHESTVDLQVSAYTQNEDFLQTQSDLQRQIVEAFAAEGIDLAVPLLMNLSPAVPDPKA